MAASEGSAARIQFKALRGFPAIGDTADKLETQAFLDASKEIVTVIGDNSAPKPKPINSTHCYLFTIFHFSESFGKLFTPVISDMNGNINVSFPRSLRSNTKYIHIYTCVHSFSLPFIAVSETDESLRSGCGQVPVSGGSDRAAPPRRQ